MANKTHRNMGIRIDSSAGSTSPQDISGYINSQSLERTINALEDTGMGLTEATYLPGLGHTKIPINGFVNSTTTYIFGPFVSTNSTAQTATRTVEFKSYYINSTSGGSYFNGEVYVFDVKFSGTKDSLQTMSATLQFTGHVNHTSRALS